MHHKLWILPLALGFVVGGAGTSSPTYAAVLNIPNLGILDTVTKITKIDFGRADQSAREQLQKIHKDFLDLRNADPKSNLKSKSPAEIKQVLCRLDWTHVPLLNELRTEYQAAKSQTDPKFKDPAYAQNYLCQLNWGN